MTSETKAYLGDGVYVRLDGSCLVLTTENGIRTTNTIILEPEVFSELSRFVNHAAIQSGERK